MTLRTHVACWPGMMTSARDSAPPAGRALEHCDEAKLIAGQIARLELGSQQIRIQPSAQRRRSG